jgi:hypothetical protein
MALGEVMAERKPYEFFLLRYVPDVAREEFVNIGLVMTQSGGDGGGFAEAYFTQNWKRAECLHPDIDVEMLEVIGRDIQNRVANVQSLPLLLHELNDQYSNAIQISEVRQCLTEDPAMELKELASTLVEMSWSRQAVDRTGAQRTVGRKWIRSQMMAAFWAEGLEGFVLHDMPASPFTNEADDFTIDFAYVTGKEIKLFHAVSLVDIGQETRMFPLRVAKIASTMPRIRTETPKFTAVTEDQYDAKNKDVEQIRAFMKAEEIQVRHVREMPEIARLARIELGV